MNTEKETVAQYLAQYLERQKVSHAFELIGGMTTVMIDALHKYSSIRVMSMHHEQGAGFAVEGFGRMADVPAVAFATSGPGATNLLTAIGSCYFDSVPALFITGQVNRHEMRGERKIRQLGFQETDIVAMARTVTKSAVQVLDPEQFPRILEEAWNTACSGRPGPVLLDIPMDVQRAVVNEAEVLQEASVTEAEHANVDLFCGSLIEHIRDSRRPLALVGGGVRAARAAGLMRKVLERLGVPTVHSLMGVDVLPGGHPLRIGMIGSYGNRWANHALSQADTLIVFGSRLDVRQTGADTNSFKGERRIFHIDCEPGEINNRVTGCEACISELKDFLADMLCLPNPEIDCNDWINEITSWREKWPDTLENEVENAINPNLVIRHLSRFGADAAAFVSDVGQHQMWAAQSVQLSDDGRFLTSGGMGAMGFGLPAAIGAAFAVPGRPVVLIAGDGGFQCNIQELQTVVRNQLPLKMVIMNNHCHGMVRQFQESYFQGRYHSTMWGYSAPSFRKVGDAYGLRTVWIRHPGELEASLAAAFEDPLEPCLIEIELSPSTNAYPKMAFGRAFGEMEPGVKPIEMEGT